MDEYAGIGNEVSEAHALNTLGVCQSKIGDLISARENCEKALELHRDHAHGAGIAESLDTLGYICHSKGEFTDATHFYQEALQIYEAKGNTYDQADVLDHLGDSFSASGYVESARNAWLEALDLYPLHHRLADVDRLRQKLSRQASDS